ncbi:MAG: hypothetical protein NTY02_19485 [Acidobacteria bacterium]|nr:hypothetical protein [Acidobacteriota bacterium]
MIPLRVYAQAGAGAYRALALAVIGRAVKDANALSPTLRRALQRPPDASRQMRPDRRATVAHERRIVCEIARVLGAHRFLSEDDAIWWELAGLDRDSSQRAWAITHRPTIVALTMLNEDHTRRLARLVATAEAQRQGPRGVVRRRPRTERVS